MWSPAGTLNGPSHVRSCPATFGSSVVAPVVDPGTYEKPSGSVSLIDESGAADEPVVTAARVAGLPLDLVVVEDDVEVARAAGARAVDEEELELVQLVGVATEVADADSVPADAERLVPVDRRLAVRDLG